MKEESSTVVDTSGELSIPLVPAPSGCHAWICNTRRMADGFGPVQLTSSSRKDKGLPRNCHHHMFTPHKRKKSNMSKESSVQQAMVTRTFFNGEKKLVRENHGPKNIELGLPAAKPRKFFNADS